MRARARFEKEAKGTSDMAYLLTLSRLKDFSVKTANLTNDTSQRMAYACYMLSHNQLSSN